MTQALDVGRKQRLRAAIAEFLQERLQTRLDKLSEDDPRRGELIAQFQPDAWLEDAARRVGQIQAVTHALKPMHPDARGTNLYVEPAQLPEHELVGSHVLKRGFASDVVGNAAALDVYKFLKLTVDGRSLLDGLVADDPAALQALSENAQKAGQWKAAFVGLTQARVGGVSSHTRAKQLYWLVGEDAVDDAQFHLLAPLYATSLAHAVYGVLHGDRYGDANKAARAARREGIMHDGVLHEYPGLAVQKLGGTKPQNISQLNSERGGVNYLLASLPPMWQPRALRQPWGVRSIFEGMFTQREGVVPIVRALLRFLEADPPSNLDTRNRVGSYVSNLIDELVALAGELRSGWPDGWTVDERCDLVRDEQLWLDPMRAEQDAVFRAEWFAMDWPDKIGHRFGNWLNDQLRGRLPVGDAEQRQWKRELLVDETEDGWAMHLHGERIRLDAPRYVPTRRGVI